MNFYYVIKSKSNLQSKRIEQIHCDTYNSIESLYYIFTIFVSSAVWYFLFFFPFRFYFAYLFLGIVGICAEMIQISLLILLLLLLWTVIINCNNATLSTHSSKLYSKRLLISCCCRCRRCHRIVWIVFFSLHTWIRTPFSLFLSNYLYISVRIVIWCFEEKKNCVKNNHQACTSFRREYSVL